MSASQSLESDTSLYYSALMSCYYTITAPTGSRIYLNVRRFDLESDINGACVDFVNILDGDSLAASPLNPTALCGENAERSYTTTRNTITIYFETDDNGQRSGFDFLFVAFSTGTCGSGQFSCNSSICIADSLLCNHYSECGDDSDETDCTSVEPPGVTIHDQTGLIAGLSVGMTLVMLIMIAIAVYCYQHNKWRMFIKRPLTAEEYVNPEETTHTTAYPVTKVYYKDKYQYMYKNPEMPDIFPGETHVEIKQQQRVKVHKKQEESDGSKTQINEAASSSSKYPDWKIWGKTGPL